MSASGSMIPTATVRVAPRGWRSAVRSSEAAFRKVARPRKISPVTSTWPAAEVRRPSMVVGLRGWVIRTGSR